MKREEYGSKNISLIKALPVRISGFIPITYTTIAILKNDEQLVISLILSISDNNSELSLGWCKLKFHSIDTQPLLRHKQNKTAAALCQIF